MEQDNHSARCRRPGFIVGLQTVQGMAEDFARRLNILRDQVRFISPDTGGLLGWVEDTGGPRKTRDVLFLIDIIPLARDAVHLCDIAQAAGMEVVNLTDEFNNWAYRYTDMVCHGKTKLGLFWETTAPLVWLQNYIIHAVAEAAPERRQARLKLWHKHISDLPLYMS